MSDSPRQRPVHRKRYLLVAFALLLLMGLVYAWSLFAGPIEQDCGWTRTETSLIFTTSMVFMSLGMLVSGFVERKIPAKIQILGTGILVGLGFVIASMAHSLFVIYLGYGALVSFGVGLGVDCVMAITLKWFPDHHGVASGGLLMGFGLGSFLLSPFVTLALETLSWRQVFWILGLIFLVAFLAATFVLKRPSYAVLKQLLRRAKKNAKAPVYNFEPREMVGRPAFWYFFAWLVLVTSGGLGLISQAVPAAKEVLSMQGEVRNGAAMMATFAMGGVSLFNGIGRMVNGSIWDRRGYHTSVVLVSAVYIAAMLLCGVAVKVASFPLIVCGFILLGLAYGGCMSCTAAMSGSFFGMKNFGINYAITTLQMIPAAFIGPLIISLVREHTGSFELAFWAFFAIALVAGLFAFVIRRPRVPKSVMKRQQRAERELFRDEQ